MKFRIFLISVLAIFVLQINLGCSQEDKKVNLEDKTAKVSYSIGIDIGSNMKEQGIELDFAAFIEGIKDAYEGNQQLTEDEIREVMQNFQKDLRDKQEQMRKEEAAKNKKEGEEFLAKNKEKEGVVTLESGLQYKVIKEGDGPIPKATDKVKTNYRGTLIDGTEFDSSYKRGRPATFPVNGVIKGWTEALQLMKVGSKWELYIPPELAYGERGAPPQIGPNETLIFEIELLGIE